MNEPSEIEISHSFDYSNVIAEIESISYLVQCCSSYYDQFIKLCSEDEEKNIKLKSEYKFFNHKKCFNTKFEITIREKGTDFPALFCKTYDSFVAAIKEGHLKNVDSIVVVLDLSFKCGKEYELKEHQNLFKITFKPYEITVKRKSNYDDLTMNQVENMINEILKKFKTQNTVFCTKW